MTTASRVRVYIACSLDGFIAGPDGDLSWLPGADSEPGDPSSTASEPGETTPEAPTRTSPETAKDGQDPREAPTGLSYDDFIADIGAVLMGRATYDAVAAFGIDWPYDPLPVLVATTRQLEPIADTITPVSGDVAEMVDAARSAAAGKDVYLDGGNLIRQAMDAGLVDELIITFVPVILGSGHSLFAGTTRRHQFRFTEHHELSPGLLQVRAVPV